jgi:predicted nucleotidyltransferase
MRPMTTVNRPYLVACLRQALEACLEVDAAWEGGSAAFDTHDALSDIDAVAVVADDALDHVFATVEAALGALSPVALRIDMPPSPGWRQKFYRLRDASEFLVVDLVLLRRSDPLQFREVELHGNGRTWIDRRGLLDEAHLDLPADAAAARARVPALRDNFAMFQHLATKERLRGHAVEALHFYQAFALRPLVEALRLLHCPQRRVFSVRYLARDLPPKVVDRITSLSFISDLDDLADKHDQVQTWFAQVMQSLEHDGPGGVPGPEGQPAA